MTGKVNLGASVARRLLNRAQDTGAEVGLAVLANDETGLVRFIDAKVLRHAIFGAEKD